MNFDTRYMHASMILITSNTLSLNDFDQCLAMICKSRGCIA